MPDRSSECEICLDEGSQPLRAILHPDLFRDVRPLLAEASGDAAAATAQPITIDSAVGWFLAALCMLAAIVKEVVTMLLFVSCYTLFVALVVIMFIGAKNAGDAVLHFCGSATA